MSRLLGESPAFAAQMKALAAYVPPADGPITKSAVLTECGAHRLELSRVWDRERTVLTVVMVNPSTADAEVDDPTILRLIAFAKSWGFGGITVVNLFSLRSSSPDALAYHPEPSHPDNGVTLVDTLEGAWARKEWVLVAWGNNCMVDGGHMRSRFLLHAQELGVDLRCLGTTNGGHPKHPLARGKHRVPDDFIPIPYELAA